MIGKRIAVICTFITVIVAMTFGIWWWQPWGTGSATEEDSPQSSLITVPLERGSLFTSTRISGKLSFGEPAELPASSGMITALPDVGTEISLGQRVYECDGKPIVLMTGPRPFWRDLSVGVSDGEDVRQLQQNLADMGYYTGHVGTKFDKYTKAAIKEWQESLSLKRTGIFSLGDVVVTSASPIRIDRVTAGLGAVNAIPATYTSPTRIVTAPLSPSQLGELETRQSVEVQLPDGSKTDGQITAVLPSKPAVGDQEEVKPQVIITVKGAQDAPSGDVRISIFHENTTDALVVPVSALIAISEDNYAVEVFQPNTDIIRVPVKIGKVVGTKAEIIAGDVNEGDQVVMSK
jgi:Membrane-fusion protein